MQCRKGVATSYWTCHDSERRPPDADGGERVFDRIFLEKFLNLFKVVDFDSDGIINEAEFQDLVSGMDLGFAEEDIDRLLQVIDPYDNQQITFSEAVALFSTELIPVENVAVLKKLSMQ